MRAGESRFELLLESNALWEACLALYIAPVSLVGVYLLECEKCERRRGEQYSTLASENGCIKIVSTDWSGAASAEVVIVLCVFNVLLCDQNGSQMCSPEAVYIS